MDRRISLLGMLVAGVIAGAAPATAGSVTTNLQKWTTTIDTGDTGAGLGSGPFGTVQIDLNSTNGSTSTANQAIITVTLASGALWANTPNHEDFAFNVSSNLQNLTPQISAPFPYKFDGYSKGTTYQAGGLGNFAEGVDCSGCQGGTSGKYSGILSLTYTFAGGIFITDFLDLNGKSCDAKGATSCFAVDIGINGNTGAAVSSKPMRRIPEPATAALVLGGLAVFGWARRRRS